MSAVAIMVALSDNYRHPAVWELLAAGKSLIGTSDHYEALHFTQITDSTQFATKKPTTAGNKNI
jgi:hypothetical protein